MTDQRFIIEMGVGNDQYGEDYTKAARRAIKDAIRHSNIPMFKALGPTLNFSPEDMNRLNQLNLGTTKVEVSGDITHEKLAGYLHSAVSYISSGSLTKHVQAVDLSMRLIAYAK